MTDPAPDSTPPPAEPMAPTSSAVKTDTPSDALISELAQWKDKAMRARADYDNLSKRVARDSLLERERAKARVLEQVLPIFELAQMAAHQAEVHPGPVSEGVVLMAREFHRLLEREGLATVGQVGEAFDATAHEAVAEEAVEGVEAGAVSRIILPGYKLGDKILRHAKVSVQPKGHQPTET